MQERTIVFPNGQQIELPQATIAAITQSSANYQAPLWQFRAEKVLKLGAHQWIYPADLVTVQQLYAMHTGGILCTAWKLFNRVWGGAAEAYYLDTATYPDHPRHLGRHVVPLVDEDDDTYPNTQIGWVRIEQATAINQQFTMFVQFTLLALITPRALPSVYL